MYYKYTQNTPYSQNTVYIQYVHYTVLSTVHCRHRLTFRAWSFINDRIGSLRYISWWVAEWAAVVVRDRSTRLVPAIRSPTGLLVFTRVFPSPLHITTQ